MSALVPTHSNTASADEAYEAIVQEMRGLYDNQISTAEAHDAARNLIGFSQQVLAIQRRLAQDTNHANPN
jgi:hypothetical protein